MGFLLGIWSGSAPGLFEGRARPSRRRFGAGLGQLALRRLPGNQAEWMVTGALFGATVATLANGARRPNSKRRSNTIWHILPFTVFFIFSAMTTRKQPRQRQWKRLKSRRWQRLESATPMLILGRNNSMMQPARQDTAGKR